MSDHIAYTMADVDAALRAIIGERIFDGMKACSIGRTSVMTNAAVKCFTEQRPEDHHSAVLLAAMRHLNETGVILPEDVRQKRFAAGSTTEDQ